VNLTRYNGNFLSPFRETLLFGKLSDQISDKSSARSASAIATKPTSAILAGTRPSHRKQYSQLQHDVQAKHSYFTGPWLNEAMLNYVHFHRGFNPNTPGTAHRLYIYPGGCCFEIGSGRRLRSSFRRGLDSATISLTPAFSWAERTSSRVE